MPEETRVKHIEIRTMSSDKRSIQERGGGSPVGYAFGSSPKSNNSNQDNQDNKKENNPPAPPSLD